MIVNVDYAGCSRSLDVRHKERKSQIAMAFPSCEGFFVVCHPPLTICLTA